MAVDFQCYRPAYGGVLFGRTHFTPTLEPSCLFSFTMPRFWTVISLFSLASPVGIFAGYGMSGVASGQGGAALSALASGTFLYVALMEVGGAGSGGGKECAG